VKKIKLSEIRIDGGTQIRAELNQDKVNEYAEQMKDGVVFPPVTVFFDGSTIWLSSGFHRYFGSKKIGNELIDCIVIEGTLEDAKWFGMGDNKHGLNMTHEDYKKAAQIAFDHPVWSTYTNAKIANHIGVSAMTIGRFKKANQIVTTDEKTYTNKHGQEAKIKTKNLGKKKETKQPIAKPDVSSAQFVEEDDRLKELSHTIEELADENTLLRDKIAIGQWNASEIEKIDIEETVANLREQLRIAYIEIASLRDSRDMYQNRHAEAVKIINSMKKKYQVKD